MGGLPRDGEDGLAGACVMPATGEHRLLVYGVSPQQQVGRGCVSSRDFGWRAVKMAT